MDRIEASKRRVGKCGRAIEEDIIEPQERNPLEQLTRPADGGLALRTDCANHLNPRECAGDPTRTISQIAS